LLQSDFSSRYSGKVRSGGVNCCWALPAQSFLVPCPLGLATIFYCLRFETSLFIASYYSQGHGGGIRPRLHTNSQRTIDYVCNLGTDRIENTYTNSSSIVPAHRCRHGPRREHFFPITPLLQITKLLPNRSFFCRAVI
jgi:hypothetical protein